MLTTSTSPVSPSMSSQTTIVLDALDPLRRQRSDFFRYICLLHERPHLHQMRLRVMIPQDAALTNEDAGSQVLRSRPQKRQHCCCRARGGVIAPSRPRKPTRLPLVTGSALDSPVAESAADEFRNPAGLRPGGHSGLGRPAPRPASGPNRCYRPGQGQSRSLAHALVRPGYRLGSGAGPPRGVQVLV